MQQNIPAAIIGTKSPPRRVINTVQIVIKIDVKPGLGNSGADIILDDLDRY